MKNQMPTIEDNSLGAISKRLLRRKQVEQALGMSRSNIYAKMDKNSPHYDPTFPSPVRIGDRAIAWVSAEIEKWIETRIAARELVKE